jgi:hypothetical protein
MTLDTEWAGKMNCTATTSYSKHTTNAINADEERRYKYWLLIFPEKAHFENFILSGDPFKITKQMEGIMEVVKGKEYRYITMNWKIADKLGSLDIATPDADSDDGVD